MYPLACVIFECLHLRELAALCLFQAEWGCHIMRHGDSGESQRGPFQRESIGKGTEENHVLRTTKRDNLKIHDHGETNGWSYSWPISTSCTNGLQDTKQTATMLLIVCRGLLSAAGSACRNSRLRLLRNEIPYFERPDQERDARYRQHVCHSITKTSDEPNRPLNDTGVFLRRLKQNDATRYASPTPLLFYVL